MGTDDPTGSFARLRMTGRVNGKVLPPRQAFTLLELLVAVTITLILAGLMLSVTVNVLNLWRRSQSNFAQTVAAKLALDLLESDLQAAVFRRDGTTWLALDIIDAPAGLANHGWLTGPGVLKPAGGSSLRPLPPVDSVGGRNLRDARFGLSGAWLRLVAANVESAGTQPVVVAYQVVRRPISGDAVAANTAPVRYSLYRSAISPVETFANGYDVTAPAYASSSNTPAGATSATYRTARNVMNPSHANLLASNVVDFGCWFHVRNADGTLQRIYPENESDTSHWALGGSTSNPTRYPEVVDVMIRILSEEGAALVEALESNRISGRPAHYADNAAWWWAEVEANSTVHVRRIELKGSAP